ncbi:MAG TPA: hypothetical protein VHE30_11475 [Polyangiaceae bacterium]|nr:hypothetical protein [Polyangiaceae bacterium]
MKRIGFKHLLVPVPLVLALFSGCDDSSLKKTGDAGSTGEPSTHTPGVCSPGECPKPAQGIACCTPNADCGTDPTGLGLGCTPNPDTLKAQECKLSVCQKDHKPPIGNACCTPLGECGWDPFMNGVFCFNFPPETDAAPPPPTCKLDECDPSAKPPTGIKSCCLPNGQCGWDTLGIGFCFPPPVPLCDVESCPHTEGGPDACCLLNGKCGLDSLGIGFCFPPPPEATCELDKCPAPSTGVKACCMPDGSCGWDSLNVGICFPPPPPLQDAGPPPPPQTTPPDDPSIDAACPSFMGVFGPQWGCCSPWGICGTFLGGTCSLGLGQQIPNGPPPTVDAGKEPFLRCTPHTADGG